MDISYNIQLRYNGLEQVVPSPEKMTFYKELYVEVQRETLSAGLHIRIIIHPKEDVVINELAIEFLYEFQPTDRLFCNGYLSQSESLEYRPGESIGKLKPFVGTKWKMHGDYRNPLLKDKEHSLHSWTYGYVKRQNNFLLLGALSEKTGFNLIRYFSKQNTIKVNLDLRQLKLSHSFPALDIVLLKGKEQAVFDRYFQLMEQHKQDTAPPLRCCLSASLPFSESIFGPPSDKMNPFEENDISIDTIIVKKGYPIAIGDWMTGQSGFPKGMSSAAASIHKAGYKAGIWLAPFVCSSSSDLFKNKKEWLLKDRKGKLIKISNKGEIGGSYYILDFYNKNVTDALISILHSITNRWSYDLICFDLLHAVCLMPPAHKTAGQMMQDAMQFLRRQCEKTWILAASIPLGSAFNLVDYCHTANHYVSQWDNKWLLWNEVRERNTALSALQTQVNRRHLTGRAFQLAPRYLALNKNQKSLSFEQQETILLINSLLSAGILLPENSHTFSPEQLSEVRDVLSTQESHLYQIELLSGSLFQITFRQNNKNWVAYANLNSRKRSILHDGQSCELKPYETMVFQLRKNS